MGTGVVALMINEKYYSAKGENNSHTQFTMHVYHYYVHNSMCTNCRNIFNDLNFRKCDINESIRGCMSGVFGMFLANGHEIMIPRRWLYFLIHRNDLYQNVDLQQKKRTFLFYA